MKTKSLSERIINFKKRLYAVHKDNVVLCDETYFSTKKKAKFYDKEFGYFWALPANVVRGTKHPDGARNRISKSKSMSAEEYREKLKTVHGDTIKLDESTYVNTHKKARFIDKDYGEWWAYPGLVLYRQNRHMKRSRAERKVNEKFLKKLQAKFKNKDFQEHMKSQVDKKYGVRNVLKLKKFQNKIKQTNLKKYGVENPQQNPEIALKTAKSSNGSFVSYHWKTNEDIVCVGSYEKKVVEYLNKNKIDFWWQQYTFVMDNGKTYRPDLYLPQENRWIEIKGYFRKDAQEKWGWFCNSRLNACLWNKETLQQKGIL